MKYFLEKHLVAFIFLLFTIELLLEDVKIHSFKSLSNTRQGLNATVVLQIYLWLVPAS